MMWNKWIIGTGLGLWLVMLAVAGEDAKADPAMPVVASMHDLMQGGAVRTTRQTVSYKTKQRPGTIIIDSKARRLYYVLADGKALQYWVGVGREGFGWTGVERISSKAKWPSWNPPAEMRRRNPFVPKHMKGGPGNPMGARALYLGGTLYRIHGTNDGGTIGRASSSGCFRMLNQDIIDLYKRAGVGTKVIVI